MQFLKIFKFFAIFNFLSAQGGFQKTALTKMNKYYNFVDPFLTIFIHPKENGKQMKVKIASLEDKFERWTGRFVKFYERCGTEGETERRRRETPAERREKRREFRKNRRENKFKQANELKPEEEKVEVFIDPEDIFIQEIEDAFKAITDPIRTVRGKKIGNLQAYAVTEENMEMLWQKITAGFQRNFDRHLLASGTCSPKVLARLGKRLGIMKQRVRGFVRAHHKWN